MDQVHKPDLDEEEALRLSEEEATATEGAQIAAAIVKSKADIRSMSDDDVVMFRLTRISQRVTDELLQNPALAEARARVLAAECELSPPFANGAKFFVPLTAGHIAELGFALEPHHVIALRSDLPQLEVALTQVPSKIRPRLRADHRAEPVSVPVLATEGDTSRGFDDKLLISDCSNDSDPDVAALVEEKIIGLLLQEVRWTFIHISDADDSSSHAARSAPVGMPAEDHPQPSNPRRYRA